MKLKTILSAVILLLMPTMSWGMEKEAEEYDERCLSGIQSHLSSTLLEWGKTTSKIPTENDISKNILKVGLYVAHKENKQWIFFSKENELYVSGYCEEGNPHNVKTGRMKAAMNQIDEITDFKNIQWKTLKEKSFLEHFEDFKKRGIELTDDNTIGLIKNKKKSAPKFDSTNYGHTEQAFISDLLDLSTVGNYSNYKAVIVMSSSNVACDQCSPSLTFSMYNPEFQLKDRVIEYFKNSKNILIKDESFNWNKIPDVIIVFSSYSYRDIGETKKIGHNKTYFFP